jgi:hypothetical protein
LEGRLALKEEQALEKDLVYEQVRRLTERVANTVQSGKEDTLTVAKKVCTILVVSIPAACEDSINSFFT